MCVRACVVVCVCVARVCCQSVCLRGYIVRVCCGVLSEVRGGVKGVDSEGVLCCVVLCCGMCVVTRILDAAQTHQHHVSLEVNEVGRIFENHRGLSRFTERGRGGEGESVSVRERGSTFFYQPITYDL